MKEYWSKMSMIPIKGFLQNVRNKFEKTSNTAIMLHYCLHILSAAKTYYYFQALAVHTS